ncbi:MAG: SRPBCC family protein [Bdellovibrionaceae bacterium]|nr:SRPBCC family protein [Pseudobdellovibrionaceae bacterium]MBX3033995.1 SRPBCC family protein [Pseudobdellovibrionaceae bacterium]
MRTDLPENSSPATARKSAPTREQLRDAPQLRESVTVRCTPLEAYAIWRDFKKLPNFMTDISQVEMISPTVSHWTVDLPRGPKVEWDAEIIHERPGEMISWQSIGDSQVTQAGSVRFRPAPGDRGTVVSLALSYAIPGGKLVEVATKLMGEDPKTMVITNLRRFKAYMETGECPTVEGQPSGRDENDRESETH